MTWLPKGRVSFIEADVLELETENGQLKVTERYFVHNTSSPPTTQWSSKSFEVVLPPEAVVDGVGGQRPNGLPTSIKMDPNGPKGHYAFQLPHSADDGDKDTLFQLSYHLPYSGSRYTFHAQVSLPADNLAVLLPKSITFTPASGADFKSVQPDPNVQTFVLKNAAPGKQVDFTVAGNGSMPREQQGTPGSQQPAGMGGQDAAAAALTQAQPHLAASLAGGIGTPINTPDPLSKYKWWILGGLAILLTAAAAFLLRKPAGAPAGGGSIPDSGAAYPSFGSPAAKNTQC